MKAFVYAIVLMTAVAIDLAHGKSCKSDDDCDEKQCCAGFTPFRGSCKSLTKENRKCLVDEPIFPFNDIHILVCPCAEGLECEKAETGKKGKENDGVCRKPTTTTTEPETTSDGGSSGTTSDQSGSGETTGDQSGSGETTGDQSAGTTQDQSTSGEVTEETAAPSSSEQ